MIESLTQELLLERIIRMKAYKIKAKKIGRANFLGLQISFNGHSPICLRYPE
jgi:hypothetical protein